MRIGPSQRANDGFTLARFTIRATSGSARLPEFFLVGAWPNSMINLHQNLWLPANATEIPFTPSLCSTIATGTHKVLRPQKTIAFLTPCAHSCATITNKIDLICLAAHAALASSVLATARVSASPPLEHGAARDFELETAFCNGRSPRQIPSCQTPGARSELRTPASLASLRSATRGEERHDDRLETIAIAISLFLLISGLVGVLPPFSSVPTVAAASGLLLNQMLNDRKVAAPL